MDVTGVCVLGSVLCEVSNCVGVVCFSGGLAVCDGGQNLVDGGVRWLPLKGALLFQLTPSA